MEITTTLVSVETKSGESQRGPWTVYKFKDEAGSIYSTFDGDLAKEAQNLLNGRALVQYEDNGKGKNLSAVKAANQPVSPSNPLEAVRNDPVASQGVASGGQERETRIHRQSAGKIAAELLQYFPEEEQTLETFFQVSERLVDYFSNGVTEMLPF